MRIRALALLTLIVVVAPTAARLSRAAASPAPIAFPQGITAGPDGALWFSYDSTFTPGATTPGGVARMTPAGVLTEFPLATAVVTPLVTGADGGIWFGTASAVVRMTISGTVRRYPVARPPRRLMATSDRAIWFTGEKVDGVEALTKLTPDGTMTKYPVVPAPNAITNARVELPGPMAVATGGITYFGDEAGPVIGRLTQLGVATFNLRPLPSGSPGPLGDGISDLISGPGGWLWFATDGLVGALDRNGNVKATVRLSGSPSRLAAGPDGRVWFDCNDGAAPVCAYSPTTGSLTHYPASATSMGGIVVGPGGQLWFTDPNFDAVFSITTSGVVHEFPLPEPPPRITSIDPLGGNAAGGTHAFISGMFLDRSPSVQIEGASASIVDVSYSRIEVLTPASPGDAVADLSVTTAGGTASLPAAFTYQLAPRIDSVSPSSGVAGTSVTITGQNLEDSICVLFFPEEQTCAVPTMVSSTELRVTAPSNTYQFCTPDSGCGPDQTFVGTADVYVSKRYVDTRPNPPGDQFTYTS